MKKLFIKSLMTVGVAGLVGLTSVAMAQTEFSWGGTIRAGYTSVDNGDGGEAIGTVGANKGSRINLNASTDLDNGRAAGAELSYNVGGALTTRRQNVWLNGGWGKLTLGQHGGIYRTAANWDQASYLGGNVRFDTGASGDTGLIYTSNLGGPFSFDIEIASSAVKAVKAKDAVAAGTPTTHPVLGSSSSDTLTVTLPGAPAVPAVPLVPADGELIGRMAATAHYDFGVAKLNFGYNNDDNAYNNTVISVNGSAAGFGYHVAYETSKDNAAISVDGDATTLGVFLSYDAVDNRVYLEYENADAEDASDDKVTQATLLGYRRDLGAGVDFTAEYVTTTAKTVDGKTLNLVLKYDF